MCPRLLYHGARTIAGYFGSLRKLAKLIKKYLNGEWRRLKKMQLQLQKNVEIPE